MVLLFGIQQGTKIVLHMAAPHGGVNVLAPNSTKMLLLVAAVSDGVADVSSHIGVVPRLRPDAMVHGLHFTLIPGSIFVCASTHVRLQSEGTAMTVICSCLLLFFLPKLSCHFATCDVRSTL